MLMMRTKTATTRGRRRIQRRRRTLPKTLRYSDPSLAVFPLV
jgi:hypothetical protein